MESLTCLLIRWGGETITFAVSISLSLCGCVRSNEYDRCQIVGSLPADVQGRGGFFSKKRFHRAIHLVS